MKSYTIKELMGDIMRSFDYKFSPSSAFYSKSEVDNKIGLIMKDITRQSWEFRDKLGKYFPDKSVFEKENEVIIENLKLILK